MVPVLKQDGRVRVYGDFKVTINPVTVVEKYPVPKIDELLTKLSGGKRFTKLDLRDADLQIKMHSESWKYVTIDTQLSLFEYNGITIWYNICACLVPERNRKFTARC